MKLSNKKIILISLSFSIVNLAFFLFYKPENPANSLVVVAQFSKISKDVKRKNLNSLDWQTVSEDEYIYSNDLLFTGEKSTAEISYLTKKLNFKMQQNTIIKIDIESGVNKPTLNVLSGSMQVVTGEELSFNVKKEGKVQNILTTNPTSIKIPLRGKLIFEKISNENKDPATDKESISRSKVAIAATIENLNEFQDLEKSPPTTSNELANEDESSPLRPRKHEKLPFYFLLALGLLFFVTSFFI